jgi:YHS domain-containing protein
VVFKDQLMTDISRRAVLIGCSVFGVVAELGESLAADAPATGGKRVALSGHDPVSYFTEGRPEKGSAEFSAAFGGATYWFRNAEHQALFIADPDHYAPRFDGYCAVMVSRGIKYEADPQAWAIADGKLWVFGNKRGEAVFREKTPDIMAKAAENWPDVRQKTVQLPQ